MIHSKRRFISHEQICKRLGVSRDTIHRWMDEEGLKYLFVGGRRRITEELLEEFLDSHTFSGPMVDEDDDD